MPSACSVSAASRRRSASDWPSAGAGEAPREGRERRLDARGAVCGFRRRPRSGGDRCGAGVGIIVTQDADVGKDELVTVARHRANVGGLARDVAERAAQDANALAEGAVGHHHVAPHDAVDVAAVDRLVAACDEQREQVEVARDERHRQARERERAAPERQLEGAEAVPLRHLTFVPGATSVSNVQSTALPSTEAASTMPFDSTPMSFAGFRFATSTTFRPTSASGVVGLGDAGHDLPRLVAEVHLQLQQLLRARDLLGGE